MGDIEKTTDRRQNMHKAGTGRPGRLGAQMETHQPLHLSVFIIYSSNTRQERHFWGGGGEEEQEEPVTASLQM
jgi:hypothetical protein